LEVAFYKAGIIPFYAGWASGSHFEQREKSAEDPRSQSSPKEGVVE